MLPSVHLQTRSGKCGRLCCAGRTLLLRPVACSISQNRQQSSSWVALTRLAWSPSFWCMPMSIDWYSMERSSAATASSMQRFAAASPRRSLTE